MLCLEMAFCIVLSKEKICLPLVYEIPKQALEMTSAENLLKSSSTITSAAMPPCASMHSSHFLSNGWADSTISPTIPCQLIHGPNLIRQNNSCFEGPFTLCNTGSAASYYLLIYDFDYFLTLTLSI